VRGALCQRVGELRLGCVECPEAVEIQIRNAVAGVLNPWRERLGRVRAKSATDLLLRQLVGAPVITVKSAASLVDRSTVQTNDAVKRLVDAGILTQVNLDRRRNRVRSSRPRAAPNRCMVE